MKKKTRFFIDPQEVFQTLQKIKWYHYIEKIISLLIKQNINFYFVGGAVRDLILTSITNKKLTPESEIMEIDIVVQNMDFNLLIEQIKNIDFQTRYELKKYPEFLTSSILLYEKDKCYRIDLAISRKEFYPTCGSLPVVSKGSIYEDLFRRDFTINAIALVYSNEKKTYDFFDPFCGIEDILNKKIRILHKKSFYDDPTRVLRAIQYAARLKFNFEKETLRCIKEAIKNKLLSKISQTRLINEFVNILRKGKNLCIVANMFEKFGITEYYHFVKPVVEVFIKNCNKIELKKYKDLTQEERFYIRLMYILEKTCGEIQPGQKSTNIIKQFKDYMVKLNIPKKHRQPIYAAVELLSKNKTTKTQLSWFNLYFKIFK